MSSTSVQSKVFASLLLIFVLIFVASIGYSYISERQLAFDMVRQQTITTSHFYVDNLNVMMVNDEMEDRDIIQGKMLNQPGIVEARVIRAAVLNKEWGEGFPDQVPVDELDHRALAGEEILTEWENEQGRVVTVIMPIPNLEEWRGTECTGCHEEAPEGTILGAVRISYSLADLDARIINNLMTSASIQVVLFLIGFMVVAWVLRQVIIGPLKMLSANIANIEASADLSRKVPVTSDNEIGLLAQAFNSMLGRFNSSLVMVSSTVHRLSSSAAQISNASEITLDAAQRETAETERVAHSVTEMEASSQQVRQSANNTAEASQNANDKAKEGVLVMGNTIAAIHELSKQIGSTSTVIQRVDERSKGVGKILDVIKAIAEQTNLLALNAAIEAARAGEQGRGFAVVADEVRGLATKTHQSISEIEKMVASLQDEAVEAVKLVTPAKETAARGVEQAEQAVAALNLIAEKISGITDLNTGMAQAADTQCELTEDVNKTIANIKDIAELTADRAGESHTSSADLVELAEQLKNLVGQFKLDESASDV